MRKDCRLALQLFVAFLAALALPPTVCAQLPQSAATAVRLSTAYEVQPDITYITTNNGEVKLDLYLPRNKTSPNPTLIYFHGGGWIYGSKEQSSLDFLPWLEMGWSVVNVDYRLGPVSLAPAAVEDCRCALRWVVFNAKKYHFDADKIVLSGQSAGGHLALITGMLTGAAGLDRQCPSSFAKLADPATDEPKVAAIINWFGITDVGDLFEGPTAQGYAVAWFGSLPNRDEIAKRVSPLTYVRSGLPPILTIHGDADPTVPYQHAVRLHQALDKAAVPNQLLSIPGGKHGGFSNAEMQRSFRAIRDFLSKNKIWSPPATAPRKP